ncbi:MAG: sensor histidine kinase [Bacillota bacterium]
MRVLSGTYGLIAVFLGQVMLLSLGALALQYYRLLEGITIFLAAGFIVLNYLVAIPLFNRLLQTDYQAQVIETQETALHKMESTLGLIRSQRHDILNHLHTIYALLQMGRDYQARRYVDKLHAATTNSAQVSRLENTEVGAFLQSKLGQAMARNISFNLEVSADLKNCAVDPYFLVIILGNLLDNAFEAVVELPAADRMVELEILEQEEKYEFIVTNEGPPIPEDLQAKIFTPGYSSKELGRGYGLAIVQETVLNHGGGIEIRNNPTAFVVRLPKKREERDKV